MQMRRFVKGPLGLLGILMLIGVALLLVYTSLCGYNLFASSDDDLSIDNGQDFGSFFSNGFVAVPVDPYVFPSSDYRGPFVFYGQEIPIAHWITLVPFSRSPPYNTIR